MINITHLKKLKKEYNEKINKSIREEKLINKEWILILNLLDELEILKGSFYKPKIRLLYGGTRLNEKDTWLLIRESDKKIIEKFRTKATAIEYGKKYQKNNKENVNIIKKEI